MRADKKKKKIQQSSTDLFLWAHVGLKDLFQIHLNLLLPKFNHVVQP